MTKTPIVVVAIAAACSDMAPTSDFERDRDFVSGRVVLEQVAAWQWAIEGGDLPVGALVRADSSAVVWTQEGRVYTVRPGSDAIEDLRPTGEVITAWRGPPPAEGAIAVVHDGRLISLDDVNGARRLGTCPLLLRARDAVSHPAAGFLVVILSSAPDAMASMPERVVLLKLDGRNCYVASGVDSPCPMATLARHSVAGVVVACLEIRRPLFKATVESAKLSLDSLHASGIRGLTETVGDSGPLWHGMPIMPINGGFLRVLADLRSDARRFEFWDGTGRHVRTSTATAPIGFGASEAERHLLFGMRGGSGVDLVLFKWSRDETS